MENGYPSAAGPVQTSESSPVRDRRSTTEPPKLQPTVFDFSEEAESDMQTLPRHCLHHGITQCLDHLRSLDNPRDRRRPHNFPEYNTIGAYSIGKFVVRRVEACKFIYNVRTDVLCIISICVIIDLHLDLILLFYLNDNKQYLGLQVIVFTTKCKLCNACNHVIYKFSFRRNGPP